MITSKTQPPPMPLVRASINLDAIAHNLKELAQIPEPDVKIMAVVKADAYGHGAVQVAGTAVKSGADWLGTARIHEGIHLRENGLDVPILIFGYTPPALADELMKYDLSQTISSQENAVKLSNAATAFGGRIKIHLKIDSGMGRFGFLVGSPSDTASLQKTEKVQAIIKDILSIARLPGLEMTGICTHFAAADSSDKAYSNTQFEFFMGIIEKLNKAGLDFSIRHAANSAAIIDMPDTHLDMVRAGISLYGFYPSDQVNKDAVDLIPAMELAAGIAHLKKVPAGFHVSYGPTYSTSKPTTLATVPIGYADGYSRLLSSKGHMLVHGIKAPIVGRVCMDMTIIDVGHIPDVCVEDKVIIFGRQNDAVLTVDEIAETLDTITYEIVSSITARVPRIYIQNV
ncbi:alanine racemase [Desulfobacterales bacterium HSG16]|nr:alanine racemase [Desulfobacterales bacterium HSG16]